MIKHNIVNDFNDHYISYNFADINIYGQVTTAIVIGQMQRFYILNGDHRQELNKLLTFKQKIKYFLKHIHLINKHSNKFNSLDAYKELQKYDQHCKKYGYDKYRKNRA